MSTLTIAAHCFQIDLEDDVTLLIPDTQKPVWFGDYHSGKLGIYEAIVQLSNDATQGQVALNDISVTYICTYSESGRADFLSFAAYNKDVSVADICTHLQATVYDAYTMKLAEVAPETVVSVNATLH